MGGRRQLRGEGLRSRESRIGCKDKDCPALLGADPASPLSCDDGGMEARKGGLDQFRIHGVSREHIGAKRADHRSRIDALSQFFWISTTQLTVCHFPPFATLFPSIPDSHTDPNRLLCKSPSCTGCDCKCMLLREDAVCQTTGCAPYLSLRMHHMVARASGRRHQERTG